MCGETLFMSILRLAGLLSRIQRPRRLLLRTRLIRSISRSKKCEKKKRARNFHVFSDNLHYLDMILKLVNVKEFTILPIRETQTEEDVHRALNQHLRFRGFTSSDQFKAWGLDIGIEHKWVPVEVSLESCAADVVSCVADTSFCKITWFC